MSEKCHIFIFFPNTGVKHFSKTAVYNKHREPVETEQNTLNTHSCKILEYLIFHVDKQTDKNTTASCGDQTCVFSVKEQHGQHRDSLLQTFLTFRHRASSVQDRRFTTLQRTLFIYLINKHISLSDICLTVHH
jgi:hypothetical protein